MERGLIDERGLEHALAMQGTSGQRLGTNVLELGLVSESELLQALGALRHTQVVTAEELRHIPAEIIRLVPPKLAKRYQIVPVKRSGGTLLIASLDPGEALIEDEIGSLTSRLTRTVMGLEARIYEALERYYQVPASVRTHALVQRLDRDTREIVVTKPPMATPAPGASSQEAEPPEPAPPSRAPESKKPSGKPKPPERPMFIELPEEERALIYGKRRQEALSREPRQGLGEEGHRKQSIERASDPAPVPNLVEKTLVEETDEPGAIEAPTTAEEASDVEAPPSLDAVSEALQHVEIRDDIADQILAFTRPCFRRRLLLMQRKDRILGWRGEGTGITPQLVRSLDVPADEASVFKSLMAGLEVWRGPLPPFAAHDTLVQALGGPPGACVVVPIRLRDRIVSFLYGDNAGDTIDDTPLDELERLAQKAGVALEVIILKNKIRVL